MGAKGFGPIEQVFGLNEGMMQWLQAQLQAEMQQNPYAQLGGNLGNWNATQAAYNSAAQRAGAAIGAGAGHTGYTAATIEDAGTSFGELIGWRMWRVNGGFLVSFSAQHAWVPGEPMVGKPSNYGSDGVWAFKEKSRALYKMLETKGAVAMGAVRMWGEVVEHTHGYRAEFARVIEICMVRQPRFDRDDDELLGQLRRTYGV